VPFCSALRSSEGDVVEEEVGAAAVGLKKDDVIAEEDDVIVEEDDIIEEEDDIIEEGDDIIEEEDDIIEEDAAAESGATGDGDVEEEKEEEEEEDDGIPLIDSLGIKEVHELKWYIIQCVAGKEMPTLQKILKVVPKTPGATKDIRKIVVPTRKSGTSVGKTVKLDDAVIYPAYIFMNMKLTNLAYDAVSRTPGVGSWVGDAKGYEMQRVKDKTGKLVLKRRKVFSRGLTVPRPLTDDEIQGFNLLKKKGKKVSEEDEAASNFDIGTMVRVVQGNWKGDVGAVRLVRDGKIVVRFWSYGNQADIYLDPRHVVELTGAELAAGYETPVATTQEEVDEATGKKPRRKDGWGDDGRGQQGGGLPGAAAVRGGPRERNRRQDRVARGENSWRDDGATEKANWDGYQAKESFLQGRNERAGDRIRDSPPRDDVRAESDVDGQWGRGGRNDDDGGRNLDWQSFAEPTKKSRKERKVDDDDFFEGLMDELSAAAAGPGGGQNVGGPPTPSPDDDFFEEIMGQLSEDYGGTASGAAPSGGGGVAKARSDDDFFDDLMGQLEEGTAGSATGLAAGGGKAATPAAMGTDDDFFDGLMDSLTSDLSPPPGVDDDEFFDSIMGDLEAAAEGRRAGSDNVGVAPAMAQDYAVAPPASVESPTASAPSVPPAAPPQDLSKFTVVTLKEKLKERGLKVSGKKQELINRLNSS